MIITLTGRLLQLVLGLLTVKLLTTLLEPAEMGSVALFSAATSLFGLFLINPVGMFINRRIHSWHDDRVLRPYFLLFVAYAAGVSALSIPACLAALAATGFLADAGQFAVLVGAGVFFAATNQAFIPALNMLGRPWSFVFLNIGSLLSSLIFATTLASRIAPHAESWILGIILGQAVFALAAYHVLFVDHSPRPAPPMGYLTSLHLASIYRFSWPVAIAVGFHWLHMQGYRYMMADKVGIHALGLFIAGYGVAAALTVAVEQVGANWFQPRLYRQSQGAAPAAQAKAWNDYVQLVLPLSLFTLSALIGGSDDLVNLLLGSAYHDTGNFLRWGAVCEWTRTLVGTMSLGAHLRMQTTLLILPNIVGAAITWIGLYVLLPEFGLVSAPLSMSLAGVAVALSLYLSLRRNGLTLQFHLRSLCFAVGMSLVMLVAFAHVRTRLGSSAFGTPLAAVALLVTLWAPFALFQVTRTLRLARPSR